MVKGSITFSNDPPTRAITRVRALGGAIDHAMNQCMQEAARDMEAYAKDNAPWTDRTGNARKGLKGYAGTYGGGDAIAGDRHYYAAVKHGDDIDYGIWLEVRWGGKWGIIWRTQAAFMNSLPDRLASWLNGVKP